MGKRDLKQQNKNLEIHVVDLISRLDPSTTGKYTKFLTRILTDNMNNLGKGNHGVLQEISDLDNDFIKPKHTNDIERLIFDYLLRFYDMDNIRALFQFHRHTEEKRIVGKDVNSYNNWDELQKDVALATLKQNQKLLEKEVLKVFENEEWLIVRPLTVESSLTYGAGTKWCTASKQNKDYFYRYSAHGVLCYVINKNDGDKYGLYYDKNNSEFSIWNAPDKRIDSVESNIPSVIISDTYKFMKSEKCNYDYFSDFEKERSEKFYQKERALQNNPVDLATWQETDEDVEGIHIDQYGTYVEEDDYQIDHTIQAYDYYQVPQPLTINPNPRQGLHGYINNNLNND